MISHSNEQHGILGPDPALCDRKLAAEHLRKSHRFDLADLYEHCPTFYPNYSIPSDGLPFSAPRPDPVCSSSSAAWNEI